jgi:hypothetical protein
MNNPALGARIKGNIKKVRAKARSPNFTLLQIWLKLHYLMTMTNEQALVVIFSRHPEKDCEYNFHTLTSFLLLLTKNVCAPKKILTKNRENA